MYIDSGFKENNQTIFSLNNLNYSQLVMLRDIVKSESIAIKMVTFEDLTTQRDYFLSRMQFSEILTLQIEQKMIEYEYNKIRK